MDLIQIFESAKTFLSNEFLSNWIPKTTRKLLVIMLTDARISYSFKSYNYSGKCSASTQTAMRLAKLIYVIAI